MSTWSEKYPDKSVILKFDGSINTSWYEFMKDILEESNISKIERGLSNTLKSGKNIFPYPEMLFSAFKYTSYKNLKVIIIGQDPYFKLEKGIPQAMGLSFSVPCGIEIPSSLANIYKNLKKT